MLRDAGPLHRLKAPTVGTCIHHIHVNKIRGNIGSQIFPEFVQAQAVIFNHIHILE